MQHKQCPKCHVAAELNAQFCSQCGHVYRTQFVSSPQMTYASQTLALVPTPLQQEAYACAKCGNAHVQKVSSLYSSGIWSANSIGVSVGGEHVSTGDSFTTHGVQFGHSQISTQLAKMLAPPPEPKYKTPPAVVAKFILYGCAVMFGLMALGTMTPPATASASSEQTQVTAPQMIGAFIFWAVIIAGILMAAKNQTGKATQETGLAQQRLNQERQRWHLAMERWNMLAYCSRCDSVCNLQTGQHTSSQNINSLL